MKKLAIAAALAASTALSLPAFAEGTGATASQKTQADMQTQTQTEAQAKPDMPTQPGGETAGLSGENLDEEKVRAIQQALKDAGADIEVDGVWGDSTAQALAAYQRDEGLAPSGELDPRTIASLGVTLEGDGPQQAEIPEEKPEAGENAPQPGSDARPLPEAEDAYGSEPAAD
ncbi:hypothetical protein C882_2199 [Caenispirillum salinarum AK4]|uniref:Peptidoglycan binding-like domain-containing protein n=1 Tax=Caenispirillum salinarum AK4 TaxID=1238182 RepID=K9GL24_9PROT|nr:peptidoglycan-binding protein [Caenispirillum salinarum]EKV26690.1 hypothetical protein C882_2199 [Caenispirillum salinarum AK4]